MSLLDQKQARELEPSLSEKILGATFSPMDAQVNPMFLTFAFFKAARRLGAKINVHTRVTGFHRSSDCIASVKTDKGEIRTGMVVNAGGVYAAEIGALLDLPVPIKPRRGQLVVTEAIGPVISHCMLSAQYIAAKFNPDIAQKRRGCIDRIYGQRQSYFGIDQGVCRVRQKRNFGRNTAYRQTRLQDPALS